MCGVWRGYDIAGIEGGEFALRLVSRQRVAPPYWRSDAHTHTLAPNLKRAAGAKDDNKARGKQQGGGDNRKQKNKKNNTNKKEQKRDDNWKKTPPKEGEAHEKRIKGRTWRWCKHHMAWGNHKEELCQLSNKRTNQQTNSLNQVAAQAASATILNSKWQALMANMARNMANN
jgi:hypothetical protein